MTMRVKRGF
jgi:uncharacterized membrane protein